MDRARITVPVRLDAGTFKRFSRFDMFVLRRRWVRPAAFALILIAFAVVALLSGKAQSGFIASVLLAVGLGLPLVYVGTFLSQVNLQARRLKLDAPRLVYTVTLDFDGVRVVNPLKKEDAQTVRWAGGTASTSTSAPSGPICSPPARPTRPTTRCGPAFRRIWATSVTIKRKKP